MKLDPWSDCITLGKPTMVKKDMRAFTIFLAERFLMGIASGNLVEAHMIVSRYWFPNLVLGNGPTQSTIMRQKGSSKAGMGCRGAVGIF